MESEPGPAVRMAALDGRSLAAAGLCVLSVFSDGLGWILAIAGIVMLRRAAFSGSAKWLLAGVALAPKILFMGVRTLTAPAGVSFPIEPWNLAASPSLWAWSIVMAAFGAYLILLPKRERRAPDAPVEPTDGRPLLIAALGLGLIGGAAVLLLGLTDGFHQIDDAGQGRWALRHAARGNVAVFRGSELGRIDAAERYVRRSGWNYDVSVVLADGRRFAVTTRSAGALEEVRKFATTANLAGKVRIVGRDGGVWTSGTAGFTVRDCVGRYEAAEAGGGARSTYEFWLDGERLAGKETVADAGGRHVRALRNIKLSDSGAVEFEGASYVEASQKESGGAMAFSFRWSAQGETGRFVKDGFETGVQKYRKR